LAKHLTAEQYAEYRTNGRTKIQIDDVSVEVYNEVLSDKTDMCIFEDPKTDPFGSTLDDSPSVVEHFTEHIKSTRRPVTHVLCIDAHYYDGVKSFLNNLEDTVPILCVSNAYP